MTEELKMGFIARVFRFIKKCTNLIFWPIDTTSYFGIPGLTISGIVAIVALGLVAICVFVIIGIFGGLGIVVAAIILFILCLLIAIIIIPAVCIVLVVLLALAIPTGVVVAIWYVGTWLYTIDPILGITVTVVIYFLVGKSVLAGFRDINDFIMEKNREA